MTRQTVVIEGELFYAFLAGPKNVGTYPSGKYEVEIGQISDADVAKLEAAGLGGRLIEQATHDKRGNKLDLEFDKGTYITPKSNVDNFTVYDGDVETIMDEAKLQKLGNGTKVRAKVDAYTAKFDGSTCAGLNDIIVLEYVAYEGGSGEEDVTDPSVEDEFTGGKTAAKKTKASDGWGTEDTAA